MKLCRLTSVPILIGLCLGGTAPPTQGSPLDSQTGVRVKACPDGAIDVQPGSLNQEIVDRYGARTVFCLKNGLHRLAATRPRDGQRFYGEGRTVLSGARHITNFEKAGRFWIANNVSLRLKSYGTCAKGREACKYSEIVFVDDRPFTRVTSKEQLAPNRFYIDGSDEKLYLVDDPAGRIIEITTARFAFKSSASNVLISNIIVEKYANNTQAGAIDGNKGIHWTIENVEVRHNSGAGVAIGKSGRLIASNIYKNGQIGIVGEGGDIVIAETHIWGNNTNGFDGGWEAGGVKVGLSDGVLFRNNLVHDNIGPGLWCDNECRNVIYEGNRVERNQGPGIFHEISFAGIIRNNVLRHNGIGDRTWFWGADILIAASENVEVHHNTVTISAGGCGIILIDQSREKESGEKYKTQNNTVHHNELNFEGAACAGGVSDTKAGDVNYRIISEGNNRFDHNNYRVPAVNAPALFVWEHKDVDWEGFRKLGLERNGRLIRSP